MRASPAMPVSGVRAHTGALAPLLALLLFACAPKATPPPPEPEVREIEERRAAPDPDPVGPLGIPEAELPSTGECRVWQRGRPAGEQPPAQPCAEAERSAPPGSRVLYRPPDDPRVVHARVMHPERSGVIVRIDLYDAEKGEYLGTKPLEDAAP